MKFFQNQFFHKAFFISCLFVDIQVSDRSEVSPILMKGKGKCLNFFLNHNLPFCRSQNLSNLGSFKSQDEFYSYERKRKMLDFFFLKKK